MSSPLARLLYRHRRWLKPLLPGRHPVCLPVEGFHLYVSLHDWAVGARIAVRRSYEPHVTAVLRALLRPGNTFVDVGANIGYHSMLAAAIVGPAGRVIAFEPSGDNRRLLERSRDANGFTWISLREEAVADVNGMVGYQMDDSNGRIERSEPARSPFQVTATRLDSALAEEPRVDMIKVDIEGAEGRALAGMEATLAAHRPVVVCEFTPGALPGVSGMSPEAFLGRLRDLGYRVAVIERRATGLPRPVGDASILGRFQWNGKLDYLDLLAWPEDHPSMPEE